VLETSGLEVTREQRARGDARRLGCFVRSVRYEDEAGWHALDLEAPAAQPIPRVDLTRDRFRLPLNRSIVRWADAFIVHSEFVRARILIERNAPTPVAVLPHGAERRWRPDERRDARAALGLPGDWRDACLLVSFGALQAHKRIDVLLEGLALALEDRPDLRLVLVGRPEPAELDARALVARHGLERAVHFAGYVDEQRGRDFLHAADLAVQLRGPSTGGSSGGVHQALSLGRAVIASDLDEQAELPDACVRKLPPGPGEAGRLAELLIALRDEPAERARMEQAARRHVDEVARFDLVAARYLAALERFPRPRGHKQRLLVQRVRRGVQAARDARAPLTE
jgi:glycosyltransferase involved in cell wall biosynthesis